MGCFQQRTAIAQPLIKGEGAVGRFYLGIGAARQLGHTGLPLAQRLAIQRLRRADQQIQIACRMEYRDLSGQRIAGTAGDAPAPGPGV